MTIFQTLRKQTALRPRRIVGLLALAWLSVVVQPCAMAFGAAPAANCPHCPAGMHGVAAGHEHDVGDAASDVAAAGHHAGGGDHYAVDRAGSRAGHHGAPAGGTATPGADGPACDGLLSDCYVLSDAQFDSRSPTAKIKDSPLDLPALLPSVALPFAGRTVACGAARPPSVAPPGERRPLSVLYCCYRK